MNHTSNWTGRIARTQTEAFGCTGIAIQRFRAPLWKRLLWAFCRHGWIVILPAVMAAAYYQVQRDAEAIKTESAAQSTCPPGQVSVWVDGSTNQCFVELGAPIGGK